MVSHPSPLNVNALLVQVRFDPRLGETAARYLEQIAGGVRSTQEIARSFGVCVQGVRRQLTKLRKFGILTGDIRTCTIQPHTDPRPVCFGEHVCQGWLDRCKSVRKALHEVAPHPRKALHEVAPACPDCEAYKRALIQATADIPPPPRVRTPAPAVLTTHNTDTKHQHREVAAAPSHDEWLDGEFDLVEDSPVTRYSLDPRPFTAPDIHPSLPGLPLGLTTQDAALCRQSTFNPEMCDGPVATVAHHLCRLGLNQDQAALCVLVYEIGHLYDLIRRAERNGRDRGAYLASLLSKTAPDVDLHIGLPLVVRSRGQWGIQDGRLVVQPRSQDLLPGQRQA